MASSKSAALVESSEASPSNLMLSVVKVALRDDSFKVPSINATEALNNRGPWCEQSANQLQLSTFACGLTVKMKTCLGSSITSKRVRKEKMWGSYHKLRTSPEMISQWKTFLHKSIRHDYSPALCQFVTHHIFKAPVKLEFDVPETESAAEESRVHPLTNDDQSALRYVAGYVCQKLRSRLESSRHPHKNDMILALMDFRGDFIETTSASEDWTNSIDRGRLWHVSEDVFLFFCVMEEEIRHHLSTSCPAWSDGLRKEIIDGLSTNEGILFQWCILSADLDTHAATSLMTMILELYITIRGFAFASSCMELYKQSRKKSTQRAKALRRTLFDSTTKS